MATLPEVDQPADTKSARGVAPRVRTQALLNSMESLYCAPTPTSRRLTLCSAISSLRWWSRPSAQQRACSRRGRSPGHVSCSFLALVLKKELEERIADLGRKGSWPDILADLDSLTETKVERYDKCFLLRSPTASRRQPRASRRRRLSPANRPPGGPGLIPTSTSAEM